MGCRKCRQKGLGRRLHEGLRVPLRWKNRYGRTTHSSGGMGGCGQGVGCGFHGFRAGAFLDGDRELPWEWVTGEVSDHVEAGGLQNQGFLSLRCSWVLVVRECLPLSSLIIDIRLAAKALINIITFNPHSSFMRLRYSY